MNFNQEEFHLRRGEALHRAGFRMPDNPFASIPFGGIPIRGIPIRGIPIRGIPIDGMVHLTDIERQNERLRQENQRLENERLRQENQRLENERLRQENERLRNNSGNGGSSNRSQPGRFGNGGNSNRSPPGRPGNGGNSNRSPPGRSGNGGNSNRSPHCSSKGSHCKDCCGYAIDKFWEQSFCNTCGKDITELIAKMRTP